jgi:hypothetical protein
MLKTLNSGAANLDRSPNSDLTYPYYEQCWEHYEIIAAHHLQQPKTTQSVEPPICTASNLRTFKRESRRVFCECFWLMWSSYRFQALRTKAPFAWINPTTLFYTGPSLTLWQLTNLPEVGTLTKTKINKLRGSFTFMHNLKWANKETNNLLMHSLSWGMNFGTSCKPKSEKVVFQTCLEAKVNTSLHLFAIIWQYQNMII